MSSGMSKQVNDVGMLGRRKQCILATLRSTEEQMNERDSEPWYDEFYLLQSGLIAKTFDSLGIRFT